MSLNVFFNLGNEFFGCKTFDKFDNRVVNSKFFVKNLLETFKSKNLANKLGYHNFYVF